MNGADRYARLFGSAIQIGRLYLLPGEHARGKTFRIYVLPEGESAIENGGNNPPLNTMAVEVFGITGGHPGWTESYGWLHKGKWQKDFAQIVTNKEAIMEREKKSQEARKLRTEGEIKEKQKNLLASYE